MSRLRERLSPRYLPLIIGGASAAVAGLPLFYVAIALSAPSLLAVPIVGIAVMLLGFFVAPRGPVEPRASKPGEGEVKNLSEEEFDALLAEVERSARDPGRPEQLVREDRFEQLVRDALDELPAFVREDLANGNVAVVISNGGAELNAFGHFLGGTVANAAWHNRILIFRDTLTRAYGDDPAELRRQVAITVRHEIAHFYGGDEQRVRALGL